MMTTATRVSTTCAATLNLTFEVVGDLPDGYHEVRTLLQTIDLVDTVDFTFKPGSCEDIVMRLRSREIEGQFPLDSSNLICKAIRRFAREHEPARGYSVQVE